MQLSKNFSLAELIASATATRRGLSNQPTEEHIDALRDLANFVLQPLRDAIGRPIRITSGYRSHDLNNAVGGSKTSQHSRGQAADFVVEGMHPYDICRELVKSNIDFDQLIQEFGQWVHVSYNNKGKQRRQVLTAVKQNGKTVYLTGLHK